MLIRLVRLTLVPDAVPAFLDRFDRTAPQIRAFDGCEHLELWRDARYPNVCTTHSRWRDAEALEAYRASDLFRTTWRAVKPLFAAAPEARSHHALRPPDAIAAAADAPADAR
jgi:quinol monooxygenase YgiN